VTSHLTSRRSFHNGCAGEVIHEVGLYSLVCF